MPYWPKDKVSSGFRQITGYVNNAWEELTTCYQLVLCAPYPFWSLIVWTVIFHLCRQSVSNIESYKLTVVISQCVYCFYARIDYSALCESELVNCIDFCMGCICVEVVCCVWCTASPLQPIMPNTVLNAAVYATPIPYDVSIIWQLKPMYCSPLLLLLYLYNFRRYLYHWITSA
jgi:hypothetical protein